MLYRLTKPFAKVTLATYFRKIYFSHRQAIPKGKPVILAANHPTAFIEPCILACWLEQPLSFVARGDLYLNNRLVRMLYDWYRLIPVFRLEDAGYGALKSNYQSFNRIIEALGKNKTVMILAEGRTRHEKRLRPIRKGTARVVFSTLEQYGDLDVQIVPVGVNYSNSDEFRSVVMIDFGAPIRALDYAHLYQENPAKAITSLTQEIEKRLAERVIHIQHEEDEALAESLFQILRTDKKTSILPVESADSWPLFSEKKIADRMNEMSTQEKAGLAANVGSYFSALSEQGITDRGLASCRFLRPWHTFLVIGGWLPALAGFALNFLPLLAADRLSRKLVTSIEFRASVAVPMAGLFWLLYYLAGWVAASVLGKSWPFLILVLMPFLGYFFLFFKEFFEKWMERKKAGKLDEAAFEKLLLQRREIKNQAGI